MTDSEITSQGQGEIAGPDNDGTVSPPEWIKVARIFVGDSSFIRQVVRAQLGSPLARFPGQDQIRNIVITLHHLRCNGPVGQLVQGFANVAVL